MKWEIFEHWVRYSENSGDINAFGKDGWQLVSAFYQPLFEGVVYIFQRPLPQPSIPPPTSLIQ